MPQEWEGSGQDEPSSTDPWRELLKCKRVHIMLIIISDASKVE